MTADAVLAGALAAAVAAVGGLCAPWVLARLPEPEPEPAPEDAADGATDEADATVPPAPAIPVVPPKIPYAELAARPRLALWCALAAAGFAAVLGASRGLEPDLPVWIFLSVLGVALGYVDWHTRLLPVRLVAPSYGVVAALLAVAYLVDADNDRLVGALVAWVAVFVVYFLLWFIYPRGLGYGDVRLSGVLGLALGWLGWQAVVVGTYSGFLLGAVVGGALALARVVDRRGYPFGPFMLLGAVLGVLAAGEDLVFWA